MTTGTNNILINPTAIIHPSAELAEGVEIGAYCVIGEGVSIGAGTRIGPHTVIEKWTTLGKNNNISQFVAIGAAPQDLGYKGEKTEVIIGDNNVIREFVTIHRATTKQNKQTVIGSNNMLMNYVHVAHDCVLANNIVMANAATLAGHVLIDSFAIVGGLVAVHQHVRIGAYSMIGGATAVNKDIPPYVMAVGNRARLYGLNKVGLRRQGFSKEAIEGIKRAYTVLFKSRSALSEAIKTLDAELAPDAPARCFIDFIKGTKRGITSERTTTRNSDGQNED